MLLHTMCGTSGVDLIKLASSSFGCTTTLLLSLTRAWINEAVVRCSWEICCKNMLKWTMASDASEASRSTLSTLPVGPDMWVDNVCVVLT